MDPLGAERPQAVLALPDQLRADPAAAPFAMDCADGKSAVVLALFDPTEPDDSAVLLEQPGVARQIRLREPGRDVSDAEPRWATEQMRLVLGQELCDCREVLGCEGTNSHG